MNTTTLRRALAATAATIAAGALLAPSGQAAPAKTETLRLYEKARLITLTKPDGTVRRALPLPEPQAGDVVDAVFDLYRGDHRRHGKARIGSDHLRCTFVAAGPPTCISHATLGSSMLVVTGTPARVILGTGRYFGATGRVLSAQEVKAVPPTNIRHNDIDVVVRIRRP
jgi:hypothetical protein